MAESNRLGSNISSLLRYEHFLLHASEASIKLDAVRSKLHMEHSCTGVFSPQEHSSERRTVQIILHYFLSKLQF